MRAPAVRAAMRDDAISGWQLNAANCDAHALSNGSFCRAATLRFLAREVRSARTRADMQRVQERLLAMLSDRLGGAPVS